jgi:hypothetical protein
MGSKRLPKTACFAASSPKKKAFDASQQKDEPYIKHSAHPLNELYCALHQNRKACQLKNGKKRSDFLF